MVRKTKVTNFNHKQVCHRGDNEIGYSIMTIFLEFPADGEFPAAGDDELAVLRGDDYDGERLRVLKSTDMVIARRRVRDSLGAHYRRTDELDEGALVFAFVGSTERGRPVRRSKENRIPAFDRPNER